MARILPGFLLAAGWLLLLFFGNASVFSLILLLIGSIAGREYVRMIVKTHDDQHNRFLLIPLLILPLIGAILFRSITGLQFGLSASFIGITFYILTNYSSSSDIFKLFSQSIFGAVYVGWLSSFLLMIFLLPQGNLWLVLLSAVTAGSDTGAYIFGMNFGKHKLCPIVSPKKTIEGALGGLLCAVCFALIVRWLLLPQVGLIFIITAAVILAGVSIVGDLTESVIKRGTNTKDSGTILAGHGGVLDRMDSILFAAPFLYYLLTGFKAL